MAHFEPLDKDRLPALIIGPCGELRHVVCRRIALDPSDLAKVVHGVRAIASASAHTEEEYAPVLGTGVGQDLSHALDNVRIKPVYDVPRFFQMVARKRHADSNSVSIYRKPAQ